MVSLCKCCYCWNRLGKTKFYIGKCFHSVLEYIMKHAICLGLFIWFISIFHFDYKIWIFHFKKRIFQSRCDWYNPESTTLPTRTLLPNFIKFGWTCSEREEIQDLGQKTLFFTLKMRYKIFATKLGPGYPKEHFCAVWSELALPVPNAGL